MDNEYDRFDPICDVDICIYCSTENQLKETECPRDKWCMGIILNINNFKAVPLTLTVLPLLSDCIFIGNLPSNLDLETLLGKASIKSPCQNYFKILAMLESILSKV